ncbi:MAG: FGGY family carbohydrate kinase [Candidatus Alcyoniella australis]|nr:FGGY family carbohydrate kinase [Candidatus Alcyoniella australis]
MSKYVLALDSGTQSSRALLFDERGEVLGKAQHKHAPMLHPTLGAVEQDPRDIRGCLFASIKQCIAEWGGDTSQISGAALTTQRNTMLATDAAGEPLCNLVSWLDRRSAGIDSEPSSLIRLVLKAMGKNGLVPRLLSKSVPRQWRESAPQMLERAHWVAPIEAWLHHQLTGEMALAPGGIAGPWPLDTKKRCWTDSAIMYKLLGFKHEWLPRIVEAGQLIGRLTPEAAQLCGLNSGLPIYSCGGDKQAEAMGAGVRLGRKDVAAVSLGTGSSISVPWPKALTHRKYDYITMASCEPGSWSLEYLLFRGIWTVRWFAQELGGDLISESDISGEPVEALLCREAEGAPAGSDGLLTWPRWSPTLQHPHETGTSVGFRETHNRGHFFRSLLEGIAYDLRRGLEIVDRATGSPVKTLAVGGGGSRSDVVVQILADVTGLPIRRPHSEELAARGAAIVAAAASGLHPDLETAVETMVPDAPLVEPIPENHRLYQRIYRRAYLPGLKILRKTSDALASAYRI